MCKLIGLRTIWYFGVPCVVHNEQSGNVHSLIRMCRALPAITLAGNMTFYLYINMKSQIEMFQRSFPFAERIPPNWTRLITILHNGTAGKVR